MLSDCCNCYLTNLTCIHLGKLDVNMTSLVLFLYCSSEYNGVRMGGRAREISDK